MEGCVRQQLSILPVKSVTPLSPQDADELATWFHESCDSGSLVRYRDFSHTIAVMQRREDIIRVARECALALHEMALSMPKFVAPRNFY